MQQTIQFVLLLEAVVAVVAVVDVVYMSTCRRNFVRLTIAVGVSEVIVVVVVVDAGLLQITRGTLKLRVDVLVRENKVRLDAEGFYVRIGC